MFFFWNRHRPGLSVSRRNSPESVSARCLNIWRGLDSGWAMSPPKQCVRTPPHHTAPWLLSVLFWGGDIAQGGPSPVIIIRNRDHAKCSNNARRNTNTYDLAVFNVVVWLSRGARATQNGFRIFRPGNPLNGIWFLDGGRLEGPAPKPTLNTCGVKGRRSHTLGSRQIPDYSYRRRTGLDDAHPQKNT